jgi:hypothetical protein
MHRSLLLLSAALVILSAGPSFAVELSNALPLSPSENAVSSPPDAVNGGGPRSTAEAVPPSPVGINDEQNAPPPSHEYPRLSLGTCWVQEWPNKPEGMAFLYQFQEIYGSSTSEDVLMIKQRARSAGHADWARSTIWIQGDCLATTDDWESAPPEWAFGFARNNIASAISMAVYMNGQRRVDWFLRDVNGNKMQIWSSRHYALNLTPDCPLGVWDGKITYQGRQYSLGDTRGLTVAQWLQGPFAQAVIRNSLFSQAFNGLQAEDFPSTWLYYFNGQIPDPKRDGIGFASSEQFEAYCRPVWRSWFLDFLKPLQDKFIIRVNGHNIQWYFDHVQDPWPEIQQAANGCKLERYFGWGGWPHWNQPAWNDVYHAIEQLYCPLVSSSGVSAPDERQGWDVTTIQLNASYDWSSGQIDQYKRAGLASTLMGDGLFDGTAYAEDYYYANYLQNGDGRYAPRDIPEMHIKLGKALGPSRKHLADRQHPLEYRQFYDAGTKRLYTVVSNVWGVPIAGIPAEDGVWFLGLWPRARSERLTFGVGKSYLESIPVGSEPAAAAAATSDGPLTLRAVPSVTRTSSQLGFSAPVSSSLGVWVFGVDGRMVRALALAVGQQSVAWDGRDMEGRRVAPGVYFARAGQGAEGQTARVLIVR